MWIECSCKLDLAQAIELADLPGLEPILLPQTYVFHDAGRQQAVKKNKGNCKRSNHNGSSNHIREPGSVVGSMRALDCPLACACRRCQGSDCGKLRGQLCLQKGYLCRSRGPGAASAQLCMQAGCCDCMHCNRNGNA